MIHVTRLHGEDITINADLIEFIESTPDTMISLNTGRKVMVLEPIEEVIERVMAYQRAIRAYGYLQQEAAKAVVSEEVS